MPSATILCVEDEVKMAMTDANGIVVDEFDPQLADAKLEDDGIPGLNWEAERNPAVGSPELVIIAPGQEHEDKQGGGRSGGGDRNEGEGG